MKDEQLERALRAGPPDEPRYRMRSATTSPRSGMAFAGPGFSIIAVAVVLVLVAIALRPAPPDGQVAGLPATITTAGVLRVGVSDEAPQLVLGGQPQGFDVDVARELGRRLGIGVQITAAPHEQLLADTAAWDIVLSTRTARSDPDRLAGAPYLWRSGAIVTRADRPISNLEELRSRSVCVVSDGAAASWFEGGLPRDAVAEPAPAAAVSVKPTTTACLDALVDESASAFVADWSYDVMALPAGLARSSARPFAIPAVPHVPIRSDGGTQLIAAVDGALQQMRSDGTLAELSRRRFGGVDYTTRP